MANIALVDDDKNILESVTMLLEQEGYHIRSFSDPAAALTALATTPPDLAILDIKMPRMDGLELLRRLRQGAPDLPVIFLTSKDEEIDELMGLNAGADDYIRKPFSQRLLLERVRAVLRRADAKNVPPVPGEQKKEALVRGKLALDPQRHECTWDGKPVRLTVTEFLILQALQCRGTVRIFLDLIPFRLQGDTHGSQNVAVVIDKSDRRHVALFVLVNNTGALATELAQNVARLYAVQVFRASFY